MLWAIQLELEQLSKVPPLHWRSGALELQGWSRQRPWLALHCGELAQVLMGVQPVCPSLQMLSVAPLHRKSPGAQAGGRQLGPSGQRLGSLQQSSAVEQIRAVRKSV